ncbi:MAG: LLM class F420-dependent oxidoreductase [Deltaproteobacteria bacterium]|jgi:probable F420-dependent oxidoreductase|nr:LLM class F420-dependent oxidoreductase [Deltaproteobacteria bacterium]
MNFMFQYPEVHGSEGDLLDSGAVGEVAIALERAGWHGMAFTEHPAPGTRWLHRGGHQSLDPFVALGGVATVTTRLRLLTYLAVLPYRNPLLLAKAAMTVDRLSQGRFILGVGTGYLKGEFKALGVDFEERNALFDEALDALALHWSGEPFSFEGRHFEARDIQALPRPAQDPIPVWIGGNARITLRRVAERGHGWMPLLGPDAMYATTRTPNPGSESEIGATIERLKRDAAGREVELDFALSYSDPSLAESGVDIERHREAFARLEAIGCTWVIVNRPAGEPGEILDFIERFAATYLRA